MAPSPPASAACDRSRPQEIHICQIYQSPIYQQNNPANPLSSYATGTFGIPSLLWQQSAATAITFHMCPAGATCQIDPFLTHSRAGPPLFALQQLHPLSAYLSRLKGVTVSGKVKFNAMVQGTPSSSMPMLGSPVITVRALKSTRLPMRLPLMRPLLPFSLWLMDLMGRPERCWAGGWPGMVLSKYVVTWNCRESDEVPNKHLAPFS